MLQAEAEFLLGYLQELWPNWEPSDTEKDVMTSFLLRHNDSEKMKDAVRTHWEKTRFKRPAAIAISQELSVLSARKGAAGGPVHKEPVPSKYFIQCMKAHAKFPGRLGRQVPVIWATGDMPDNENYQWEIAEQMRAQHQELYGGEWKTFQNE